MHRNCQLMPPAGIVVGGVGRCRQTASSYSRCRVPSPPPPLTSELECRSTAVAAASAGGDSNDVNCQFRRMRNLSEKKRRDQFNLLINELCSMVSPSTGARKMDKSSVLKSTIAFLRSHNEVNLPQVQEYGKPPFLSNDEFAHLMLEALDAFIIAFETNGRIVYVSDSIASLLGYLPSDVLKITIYDLIHEDSRTELYQILAVHLTNAFLDSTSSDMSHDLYMKCGPLMIAETDTHKLVRIVGSYIQWNCHDGTSDSIQSDDSDKFAHKYSESDDSHSGAIVATVRLQTPQLLRDMSLCDDVSNGEFTSRHSLEWKFLYLDHRAPPIIGYLPLEVVGTSGYDYYHVDDLERIVAYHEALMQTGEGTSSYYRFLTKGHQWIWLQTRYYITYHQWNSKPEFVVCKHVVISCAKARLQIGKEMSDEVNVKSVRIASSPPLTQAAVASVNRTRPQLADSRNHPSDIRLDETRTQLQHQPRRRRYENVYRVSVSNNTSLNVTSDNFVSGGTSPGAPEANFDNGQSVQDGPNEDSRCAQIGEPSSQATPQRQYIATYRPMSTVNSSQLSPHDSEEQLRRKHQMLEEQILQQQEELRRVHKQLMFAQFMSQANNTDTQMPYPESEFQMTIPMDVNPSDTFRTAPLEQQQNTILGAGSQEQQLGSALTQIEISDSNGTRSSGQWDTQQ